MVSTRISEIQQPPLVELGQLATSTPGCISLGQGAPYYRPPDWLIDEFLPQISQPETHRYTADPGILPLRQAISDKLRQDQNINTSPSQIIVTPGANQAFYNVLVTLTDPGDEVILLTPYYFNHYMACLSLSVEPVQVPHLSDFSIDFTALKQAISSKTRVIVLVNPGNPTGMVYSREDLQGVIELSEKYNVYLIADETYEYFAYHGATHVSLASLSNDNIISIGSFSKTYGIPGWRLGYYSASQDIIDHSLKIQDTIGICAPHSSQLLGLTLLQHREKLIPNIVTQMETNHRLTTDLVEEVTWLEVTPSSGAYYLFPKQLTSIPTESLVRDLIQNYKVYIVPGEGFGSAWKDYCRISFANVKSETLKEAFSRLRAYH